MRPRPHLDPFSFLDKKVRGDDKRRNWADVLAALDSSGSGASRRKAATAFGITADAIKKKFPNKASIAKAVVWLARRTAAWKGPAVTRARFKEGRIDPASWRDLDALLQRVQRELTLTEDELVALLTVEMVLHQVRATEQAGEKK